MKLGNLKSYRLVLVTWLVLAAAAFLLAVPTVRDTGLDYDEALYGHLTRDFLEGHHCLQHMPGSSSVEIAGRPFPLFVQGYLGAVKCWMLLPGFTLFGSTVAAMRFTMLAWGLLGVFCLMLWTKRMVGEMESILVGLLVVMDPAFFFPTVCDWGAFVPSFVCRCAGLFCAAIWWQRRRVIWLFLAGAAFGFGFFNKIDFIVFLIALASAAWLTRPRQLGRSLMHQTRHWLWGGLAFVLASSLMLVNVVRWFRAIHEVQAGAREGELAIKWNIARAVLDGSYFHRLMEAGGLFQRMFDGSSPVWTPSGPVLLLSVLVLVFLAVRETRAKTGGWPLFLLVALVVSCVGVWLLPDAVRIHHMLLIYPFPQLVIATASLQIWRWESKSPTLRRTGRTVALVALASLLIGNVLAVRKTQSFSTATGGRGMWAKAFGEFAEEIKDCDELTVASLDWGFHEQLSFLTRAPKLYELTWNLQQGLPVSILPEPSFIYLVHPPESALFEYGQTYLQAARAAAPQLIVESRTNREGRVVFQFFRFPKK